MNLQGIAKVRGRSSFSGYRQALWFQLLEVKYPHFDSAGFLGDHSGL